MIDILQTKAWALESRFFNRLSPLVLHRIASGGDLSALIRKEVTPEIKAGNVYQVTQHLFYSHEDGYHYLGEEEDTIISRLSIKGGISKGGDLCSYGTSDMGNMLLKNDSNKKVIGHILEIDSPGGAVDGTPELGHIIANLSKPVVSYVDGLMASAAYWLGSQSSYIVTNQHNYTEVGSIGTLCMLMNEGEWLKKEGLKVEIMRAEQSKDKARLNSIEEWPEESINDLQEDLNQITDDFIKAVMAGRKGKLSTIFDEDIFTGRMYSQYRSLELGMTDKIGTIADAISAVNQISKNKKSNFIH
jgi:protease-4